MTNGAVGCRSQTHRAGRKNTEVRLLTIIVIVLVGILGYGYWHSYTHSSFYVSVDVQEEADFEIDSMMSVEFLDSNGRVLANGVRDEQHDFLHLVHPAYGDCREVERMASFSEEARASWQECFERQSIWIANWIREVNKVNIMYGDCLIQNSPITVSSYNSDWYLWWVPHPHIGGKPYSDYSSTLTIDQRGCIEERP